MTTVKKTVSIPEDLYKEAIQHSNNFSQIVKDALQHYLTKKRREKILSFAGSLKSWEINDGLEYTEKIRDEDIRAEKDREKRWDI